MAIDNNKLLCVEEKTKLPTAPKEDLTVEDDFAYARATIYNLADKNAEALDLMMDLARESEHPRAFEVLTGMIKQNADLAEQLMVLSQRKQKLSEPPRGEKAIDDNTHITNNNVFVGTTEELQRLLLDAKDVTDHGEG